MSGVLVWIHACNSFAGYPPDFVPGEAAVQRGACYAVLIALGCPKGPVMSKKMAKLQKAAGGSLVGRSVGAFMRFGVLRGLRSVEIKPETFRKQLADKHGLWVPDFTRMRDGPIERLDAIAKILIRG